MKNFTRFLSLATLVTVFVACMQPQASTNAASSKHQTAQPVSDATSITIRDLSVLTSQAALLKPGLRVKLAGTYAGWAMCQTSTAKTRSDWVLKQGEHCIYVTGGLPKGIVPPPSKASEGMPVDITGVLTKGVDNTRWLVQFENTP